MSKAKTLAGTVSTGGVLATGNNELSNADVVDGLLIEGQAGTSGQALLSQGSGQPPAWGQAGVSTGKAIAMSIVFSGS